MEVNEFDDFFEELAHMFIDGHYAKANQALSEARSILEGK